MHIQLLITHLSSIYELSAAYEDYLRSHVREEDRPKHHLLWEAGQKPGRIYFIANGIARGYYLKDRQPVTSWFMQEKD